jgi:hypothetical protein
LLTCTSWQFHHFAHFQVKGALLRTLALPESADKHAHIQLLAGLISTMIDNCPSTPNNAPLSASLKLHQYRSVAPVACYHIIDTTTKYTYKNFPHSILFAYIWSAACFHGWDVIWPTL